MLLIVTLKKINFGSAGSTFGTTEVAISDSRKATAFTTSTFASNNSLARDQEISLYELSHSKVRVHTHKFNLLESSSLLHGLMLMIQDGSMA